MEKICQPQVVFTLCLHKYFPFPDQKGFGEGFGENLFLKKVLPEKEYFPT